MLRDKKPAEVVLRRVDTVQWRRRESNPRPLHCERSALPTELRPRMCGCHFSVPQPKRKSKLRFNCDSLNCPRAFVHRPVPPPTFTGNRTFPSKPFTKIVLEWALNRVTMGRHDHAGAGSDSDGGSPAFDVLHFRPEAPATNQPGAMRPSGARILTEPRTTPPTLLTAGPAVQSDGVPVFQSRLRSDVGRRIQGQRLGPRGGW